jgi:predicted double-glycine peptidase
MTETQTPQQQLLAEQLLRFSDNISARLKSLENLIKHQMVLEDERLETIRCDIRELRSILTDHELRIRSNTDGVAQFKVWSGLSGGGSLFISVAALIRSIFGG